MTQYMYYAYKVQYKVYTFCTLAIYGIVLCDMKEMYGK